MICSRRNCNNLAQYEYGGDRNYCPKHYRFGVMVRFSKYCKKQTPSYEELEKQLKQLENFQCPRCNKKMIWKGSKYDKSRVISLQHNNNGTIQFLCQSCNAAHGASSIGDNYLNIPNTHKYCPDCNNILHKNKFYKCTTRGDGLQQRCKTCDNHGRMQRHYKK